MKIRRDGLRNVLLGSLLLAGAAAGTSAASAQVSAGIHVGPSGRASVDLGFFYDDLAPYGNWVQRPSYGWVWAPRAVASSWRPYQNGHWVATDAGWVWVTDEPYGWATYHYGRWYDDPEIGWSWVPGDTWGPSWVSFQDGGDYVGWAPLPPGVDVSVGFSGGGYAYGIAPASYLFVPERDFLAPRLGGYYVGGDRINQFWGQTRNYTNYRNQGGRWYNQGVPVDRFQRFGNVPRYQVADVAANFRQRGGRIEGNRLAMFRPQVQRAARLLPPNQRPGARAAVVSAAQFRAAHGDRVAFAQRSNQRLAAQAPGRQQQRFAQQQQRQQQVAVQRQARTAQVERQQLAQTQRQTRNHQIRNTMRNDNVAQRQAQANRQMERRQLQVNRQQQQHQFQANRQQERRQAQMGRQQQQRQFQAAHQQQQRQAQMGRQQQQRQFAQQQRQNRPPQQVNRGGGPGRQPGQPGRNNRQHPGPGGQ